MTITEYQEVLKIADMQLAELQSNLQPREAIFPTDPAPVLRLTDKGITLSELRFGLIPYFHKGAAKEWKLLTTNARSENVTTSGTYKQAFRRHRCLVPFTSFFEWTGEKGNKQQWQFTPNEYSWLAFAGIWDNANTRDGQIESFSLITMPAGQDVVAIHNRQPIILTPDKFALWLNPDQSAKELLEPPKAGLLNCEKS